MDIEISEIREKIFLLKFQNQYDVTSTFMRLQEYYESPYKYIKGHYFTIEKYMDLYAKENGNFTYNEDWAGFNVPGNIVRDFFELFRGNLINKEKELYRKISFLINSDMKFYLLGIYEDEDLNHEISHGYYYLDENYKKNMQNITDQLDSEVRSFIKKALRKMGYCESVINDEIQAYLSTSYSYDLVDFNLSHKNEFVKMYRKVFKEKDKQDNFNV
jgi:hypothetical protein